MTKITDNNINHGRSGVHISFVKKLFSLFSFFKNLFIRIFQSIKELFLTDIPAAVKSFNSHDGELTTCALAFFLLISFIPLSLVIISALSFFYKSGDWAANIYLHQIKLQLPTFNIEKLISNIDKIVYHKRFLAFVWIPFLFWWGSLIFDVVERALEKAFRVEKSRKYWRAKIRHFLIIIGISIIALTLTLFSTLFAVLRNTGIAEFIEKNLNNIVIIQTKLTDIIKLPILFSSIVALFINTILIFILYRFVPPRKLDLMANLKGALFASLSYEIIKIIFSFYIKEINDFTSIFGSLSTIVILIIWIWYTCFLFVIGAEMSWVFYHKKRRGHHKENALPAVE